MFSRIRAALSRSYSAPAASSGDTGLPGASAAARGTFGGLPRRAGAGARAGEEGSAVVAMAGDAVGACSCGTGGGGGAIPPRKGRGTVLCPIGKRRERGVGGRGRKRNGQMDGPGVGVGFMGGDGELAAACSGTRRWGPLRSLQRG
jgi:hypothetical protein